MSILRRLCLVAVLAASTCAAAAGIGIVSPQEGMTVHDNAGNLTVTAKADAGELPQGSRIRFLLDGRPVGPDTTASVVALEKVERGTHVLQALLLDRNGKTIARSAPVTFHMWQASRKNPAPGKH